MSAKSGSPPDRSWWTMFIIQVVPLLGGTDTTMSPSRHSICCWIVSLIHGGGPCGGPFCSTSCVAVLTLSLPRSRCDASTSHSGRSNADLVSALVPRQATFALSSTGTSGAPAIAKLRRNGSHVQYARVSEILLRLL